MNEPERDSQSKLLFAGPKRGYAMRKLVPFSKRSFVVFMPLCIVCLSTELRCSAQQLRPTCDAQSVFRMAKAELKRQQYDQAERELDRLLGCQALPAIDTFNLGWLYGRARNFRKALSEFNSVSKTYPTRGPTNMQSPSLNSNSGI